MNNLFMDFRPLIFPGLLFILMLSNACESRQKEDWFPLQARKIGPESKLAMQDWLEIPAGKKGWIRMENGDLKPSNGQPLKFWGVNIASGRPYVDNDEAEAWSGYLASYGVNSVRFHKFTNAGLKGPTSVKLANTMWENLDYFHNALREKGLYYGWSPIYGHKPKPGEKDKLLDYQEIANIEVPWSHLNGATTGLVNFAEDLQDLHIELVTNMLEHKNPATGLRYADDPALAFVELQNEDNIFWGAIEESLKQTPTYRNLLCRKFSNWLMEKYGSHETLINAWNGKGLQDSAHLEKKNIYPHPNHSWFSEEYRLAQEEDRPVRQHYLDKARFLYEEQMDFYNRFVDSIRATGYKGMIIASCWQAGSGITHYYNLHADAQTGIIDRHNYFGGGTGHRLEPGEVKNQSMLENPGSGLLSTGMQRVFDRPFSFSEWMSKLPNEWIAESAPLIAAYGMGLQDWAASYSYASNAPQLSSLAQAENHGVYNVDSPIQMGLYPFLARMIYRGDVESGEVMARRTVTMEDLKSGKLAFNQQVKQTHDVKSFSGDVPQEILAIGKTGVKFEEEGTGSFMLEDLSGYWNKEEQEIHAQTGDLAWNYGEQDYVKINTEGTVGMIGFAGNNTVETDFAGIDTENEFAVILATAEGRQETLQNAGSILIGTVARIANTGMEYNAVRDSLVAVGEAPLRLESVQGTLTLKNHQKAILYILDHAGKRTGEKMVINDGVVPLNGTKYKTFYYELVLK